MNATTLEAPLTHIANVPRVLQCPDREAAWRQYWRHAANAAVFAILTHRHVELLPSLHQQGSVQPGTRPPNPDPPAPETSVHHYEVEIARVILQLPQSKPVYVSRQQFILNASPRTRELSEGQRLIFRFLLDTPRARTEREVMLHAENLYRYDAPRQQYRVREGRPGDLPWLMEYLLAPHSHNLIDAMGFTHGA